MEKAPPTNKSYNPIGNLSLFYKYFDVDNNKLFSNFNKFNPAIHNSTTYYPTYWNINKKDIYSHEHINNKEEMSIISYYSENEEEITDADCIVVTNYARLDFMNNEIKKYYYRMLIPKLFILNKINSFINTNFNKDVIGFHFRDGNGEFPENISAYVSVSIRDHLDE